MKSTPPTVVVATPHPMHTRAKPGLSPPLQLVPTLHRSELTRQEMKPPGTTMLPGDTRRCTSREAESQCDGEQLSQSSAG